jgi:TPP-dependent indolepyruvate ferredoxin oxidoreductase alpha subunit
MLDQPASQVPVSQRTNPERSFAEEVRALRLGDGEIFRGEGILAVTKAILQSGVAYVGGYQGAPISHLMDVFADADPLLRELGVHFEQSDNGYSAATGGRDIRSSRAAPSTRRGDNSIEKAVRGVGVEWARRVTTYDIKRMKATLKEAMTTPVKGPKVIVAESECMLNRQRCERPAFEAAVKAGKRRVRSRFGVDEDVCTGDHSRIRLSDRPSLTIRPDPDPLRDPALMLGEHASALPAERVDRQAERARGHARRASRRRARAGVRSQGVGLWTMSAR